MSYDRFLKLLSDVRVWNLGEEASGYFFWKALFPVVTIADWHIQYGSL